MSRLPRAAAVTAAAALATSLGLAARVCVWILARGVAGRAIDAEQRCESLTLRFTEA